MVRLNNKGFAISSILYGLLIVLILTMSVIMKTMAFNREINKEFVDDIKDQLERDDFTYRYY